MRESQACHLSSVRPGTARMDVAGRLLVRPRVVVGGLLILMWLPLASTFAFWDAADWSGYGGLGVCTA